MVIISALVIKSHTSSSLSQNQDIQRVHEDECETEDGVSFRSIEIKVRREIVVEVFYMCVSLA